MAVEDRLVVELGADIEPLRKGLQNGARELDNFSKKVTGLGGGATKQGDTTALSFLKGLRSRFARDTADAKEELFRGLINPQEYRLRGVEASRQFNDGILRGMARLGDTGQLTSKLHTKLVAELKQSGLQAGTAFSTGVAQGMTRSTTTLNAFSGVGQRAANASVAVAFGLEAIARGGTAAEGGMRTALRSVAAFAAMFGPQGLIVSGVAAATAAIIDLYNHTREESDATTKKIKDDLAQMVRAGDVVGIQRSMQQIAEAPEIGGRGLGRMQRELQRLLDLADQPLEVFRTRGPFGPQQLQKEIDALKAKIKPLKDEFDILADRLKNFPTLPRELGSKPITITAAPASRDLKDFNDTIAQTIAHVKFLAEVQPSNIAKLPLVLVDAWNEVNRRLDAQQGKVNDVTIALERQLLALREASDALAKAALGQTPGARPLTPSVGAGTALPKIEIKAGQLPGGKFPILKPLKDVEASLEGIADVADQVARIPLFGGWADDAQRAVAAIGVVLRSINLVNRAKEEGNRLGQIAGGLGVAGGIIGGTFALHSLIKGLTEPSAEEVEQNALLKQNNERLEEVALSLKGFENSIGSQLKVGGAISDRALLDFAKLASGGGGKLTQDLGQKLFIERLNALGVSFAELNKIAKDNGIVLLDKEGHVVAAALEQLGKLLPDVTKLLTTWGKTLEETRAKLSLRDEVFDVVKSPIHDFANELEILRSKAPKLAEIFDNIDLSSAEGRKLAEQALRNLVEQLEAGTLDASLFGDLLSKDAFIEFLKNADDALDDLAESARDANEAIRNAPSWFKLASSVFSVAQPRTTVGLPAGAATSVANASTVNLTFGDVNLPVGTTEEQYQAFRQKVISKARVGGPRVTAQVMQLFPA